jgi:glutathione reductase (NADPH)
MTQTDFDTIVIGGGSAGMAFATQSAKLGARIAMIERDLLGGTCVNRGCVPKKILWTAGQMAHTNAGAAAQGIMTQAKIDFHQLIAKRDAHISDIRDTYAKKLEKADVTLIRGDAVLTDNAAVRVNETVYTARQIVLATGGRPAVMDIEGAKYLSDSDDVLGWATRPDSIVIIGGGYIGCEFAAIFHALGADVTLVHDGPHILDTFPRALALHVQDRLETNGIRVLVNDSVTAVNKTDGQLEYTCKSDVSGRADAVVAAAGRTPNIDQLGPRAQSLDVADSGALAVSERFETSTSGIYAIGDIADRLPLTPVATADGTALAHILHGDGAVAVDLGFVATTSFVYPPAAFVGSIGDDPLYHGTLAPLAENVLGQADDPDFYQIDATDGTLSGAAIAADGAENIIAMAAALIAAKAPADTLTKATPVHPSFAEEFFTDR